MTIHLTPVGQQLRHWVRIPSLIFCPSAEVRWLRLALLGPFEHSFPSANARSLSNEPELFLPKPLMRSANFYQLCIAHAQILELLRVH